MLLQLTLADAAVADLTFAVVLAVLSQIFAQVADWDAVDAVLLLLTLADAAVADLTFVVVLAVLSQIFAQAAD